MVQNPLTTRPEDSKNTGNFRHHLKKHHVHAMVVMMGFIMAQFFLMNFMVDASELTIKTLLDCTNKIRLAHNTSNDLVLNDQLNTAAANKLADMAQYQYWAHQNPVTGKQPWDFIDAAGYPYETAGENLAYGFTDSQKICDAWEKSPKHLANIVNTTYQEIGFAIDKANLHTSGKGILVVQMFGSRTDFLHAPATSQTQQSLSGQTQQNQNCTEDSCSHSAAPKVEGASTVSNTQDDSVYAPSSFIKNILPYAIGVSFFCTLLALIGVFNFKKNKKRVNMLKRATVIFFVLSIGLLIFFFLTPTL